MSKPTKSVPRSPRQSLADASDPAKPTGSQGDYETFLPLARALPAAGIIHLRADLPLALQNAQLGVSTVMAEEPRLSKLPETDLRQLAELPRQVLATIFADTQIERSAPDTELQGLLARGSALRSLLLKTAESLAEAGLLSSAAVAKIRAGRGRLDSARDCVELAALFSKNAAALRGKSPVTSAQIQEASEVGTQLLSLLKPTRMRRSKAGGSSAASDRDRLSTLVLARHDALWRAGAYLIRPRSRGEGPAAPSQPRSKAKEGAACPGARARHGEGVVKASPAAPAREPIRARAASPALRPVPSRSPPVEHVRKGGGWNGPLTRSARADTELLLSHLGIDELRL